MSERPPGYHYPRAHLFLAAASTLATIAGLVVALVATDTIAISRPGESQTAEPQPARTVTQTVTETVTVPAPAASPEPNGPCSQEPNEDRLSAVPVSLGSCDAAIETENDRDWYRFETPSGGQFELTVQKAETSEEFGTIIATVYVDEEQVESEQVASDEPFVLRYTLAAGSELLIELIDGCSPGGCGVGGYSFELEPLS